MDILILYHSENNGDAEIAYLCAVANDYFRRLHSVKRGGKVVTSAFAVEPVSAHANGADEPDEIHKTVLFAQLDRKMREAGGTISARDRNLF